MADLTYLTRMDLADIHAPQRLAAVLHSNLGPVKGPVPVVDIAKALDVSDDKLDKFDGFEGMLLANRRRSQGCILANTSRSRRRTRSTVARELGHFLMERHVPSEEAGFRCTPKYMRMQYKPKQHYRQEAKANQFAIELQAPSRMIAPLLTDQTDLRDAMAIRDHFNVSLEASLRRLIHVKNEPLAAIWSQNGTVRYSVKSSEFRFLTCNRGHSLPKATAALQAVGHGDRSLTSMTEAPSMAWTRTPDIEVWEKTRVGSDGHAATLLWADLAEEDEDEDLPELDTPTFR